ncbi:MAG: hypothetical protein GMKNLPBB_03374 [Myxococcota bacterium]|nr:hypothetical protein [Myxococcota bacterium]
MRCAFAPGYQIPLPVHHRFPMGKYPALRDILLRENIISPNDLIEPGEAGWGALALVHTPDYLRRIADGTLTPMEERRLGLPWSPVLLRRSRLAVQGTILAMDMALEDGIAANLAGGTHHAFADRGEGFCVFNDVAVAIRQGMKDKRFGRALIVDLDVHQGNGTASIFRDDNRVFTFSMHGKNNFPFHKEKSRLDVELPDGADDELYLSALHGHLPGVVEQARPDIVFYLAGVDVVESDRFGKMRVTGAGLRAREDYVLRMMHMMEIPLVLTLAGGYAPTVERTAHLHAAVHRAAKEIYR